MLLYTLEHQQYTQHKCVCFKKTASPIVVRRNGDALVKRAKRISAKQGPTNKTYIPSNSSHTAPAP